jgi:hypothetical protein
MSHPDSRLKQKLKAQSILLAFFSLFTSASLLIPTPMFPGNWFCALFGGAIQDYVRLLSALFNGAFYGIILWLMFIGIGKKLEG